MFDFVDQAFRPEDRSTIKCIFVFIFVGGIFALGLEIRNATCDNHVVPGATVCTGVFERICQPLMECN